MALPSQAVTVSSVKADNRSAADSLSRISFCVIPPGIVNVELLFASGIVKPHVYSIYRTLTTLL